MARSMDVLCCLPRQPFFVGAAELVADCGLKTQVELMAAIEHLKTLGVRIARFGVPGQGWQFSVLPESWELAKSMGEKYWDERESKELLTGAPQ